MKFRTQYDRVRINSDVGSKFQPTYELKVDENGVKDLVETGIVDLYAQIQSWRDSCELKTILARYVNGDVSALQQHTPFYGDFTGAPKSLAEYYQLLLDAESRFDQLPLEVRKEFHFSPSEFFSSIGTEKFDKIFNSTSADPIVSENIEKEVSVNES